MNLIKMLLREKLHGIFDFRMFRYKRQEVRKIFTESLR